MSASEEMIPAQQGGPDTDDTSSKEEKPSSGNDSSQGPQDQVAEEGRLGVSEREDGQQFIDNDLLIPLVQERVPLWDPRDRHHSDSVLTQRLWQEVAKSLWADWARAAPQHRKDFRKRVKVRWRSMKDRFNKDLREEIRVRSGAAQKLKKYKYHRVLAFLRPVVAHRPNRTWSSTTEPASTSLGAATYRPPTELSSTAQSSSSNGATWQASQAGDQVPGPAGHALSQPTDTGYAGSARQRQRARDRAGIPEFVYLGQVFQGGISGLGEQLSSSFTQMKTLSDEVHRRLDRLEADHDRQEHHFFSAIHRGIVENLTPDLQLHVMNACQAAYREALQQSQNLQPQSEYVQQSQIPVPTVQQGLPVHTFETPHPQPQQTALAVLQYSEKVEAAEN